jgi:hypothetical protein
LGHAKASLAAADPGVVSVLETARFLYAAEARSLVSSFVARAWDPPLRAGAELAWIIEALVGGDVAIEAFATALTTEAPEVFMRDRPCLAAYAYELGFVVRRLPRSLRRESAASEPPHDHSWAMALLEATWRSIGVPRNDVARALDLILHGKAGAERSGRVEADFAFADDDVAFASRRILDPSTGSSPPDAYLVTIAGDALLDRYAARISDLADPGWLATQLGALGSPRAVSLLLSLFAARPESREQVIEAFARRPKVAEELAAHLDGPRADVARAVLAALPGDDDEEDDDDGDEIDEDPDADG